MASSLGRVFRTLFGFSPDADVEWVGFGNFLAAFVAGIAVLYATGLSFGWAGASAAVTFFGLCACLANRYTAWIPAVLGSVLLSASLAFLGGLVGVAYGPAHAGWVGAVLGFAAGLAVSAGSYLRFLRSVLRR